MVQAQQGGSPNTFHLFGRRSTLHSKHYLLPKDFPWRTCAIGIDLPSVTPDTITSQWNHLSIGIRKLADLCVEQQGVGGTLLYKGLEFVITNPLTGIGEGTCLAPPRPPELPLGRCIEAQANATERIIRNGEKSQASLPQLRAARLTQPPGLAEDPDRIRPYLLHLAPIEATHNEIFPQNHDLLRPHPSTWAAARIARNPVAPQNQHPFEPSLPRSPGSAFTPYRHDPYQLSPYPSPMPAPASSYDASSAPRLTLVKRVLSNPSRSGELDAAAKHFVPSWLKAPPGNGADSTLSPTPTPNQEPASASRSTAGGAPKIKYNANAEPYIPPWLRATPENKGGLTSSSESTSVQKTVAGTSSEGAGPSNPNTSELQPTTTNEVRKRVGDSWVEDGAWVQKTLTGKQGIWMKVRDDWLPLPKLLHTFHRKPLDQSPIPSYFPKHKREVIQQDGTYAKFGRKWASIAGGKPPKTEPRVFVLPGTPREQLAGLNIVILPSNYAEALWPSDRNHKR